MLVVAACAGCTPIQTRFEILSFKDPAAPQLYAESFPEGSFSISPLRNHVITFEIAPHEPIDSRSIPRSKANDVSQIVRIEMFWKPRPGTTYADSTQTNANISYCLINGRDAITYEGAGFVFVADSTDGKSLTGQIESATMVPVYFQGDPGDLFGPCHIKGSFTARSSLTGTAETEQRLRRHRGTTTQPAPP